MLIALILYTAKILRKIDTYSLPRCYVRYSRIMLLAEFHFSARKRFARRNPDSVSGRQTRQLGARFIWITWKSSGLLEDPTRERVSLSIDRHCRSKVRLSRLDRESPVLERLRVRERGRRRKKESKGENEDGRGVRRRALFVSFKTARRSERELETGGKGIWRAKRQEIILDFSTVAMRQWISYLLGLTRVKRKSILSIRPHRLNGLSLPLARSLARSLEEEKSVINRRNSVFGA